ncbi:MAG: LbtU family siderophore porin [Desulfobacteraceae bacterium]|nr:LbtU family siderophore porin [Desulfobacteraceae bacterium]
MKRRSFTTSAVLSLIGCFTLATSAFALDVNDFTPEKIKLSGTIEIEAGFENNDIENEDTSDISLATAELGIEAKPVDWLTGFALLSWDDDEDKIIFDEAHITLGATDTIPYYLQAGKFYMPFGVFATNMISDPLTLEFAEVADTGAQLGIEVSGFRGSVYTFNGETDEDDEDDKLCCFGASVGYAVETEAFTLAAGADWINNVLESDTMNEYVTGTGDLKDYVPGFGLNAMAGFGPMVFMAEYLAAADDIEFTDGAKHEAPSVWAIEAGYTLEIAGKETTFALAYQATKDAEEILPESKILTSVGVGITDALSVALEYSKADDYSVSDGGTGNDVDAVTMQLALEF